MKLSDIFEEVVDFAAKRQARDFMNKVGSMSDKNREDKANDPLLMDLQPKHNKLIIQVQKKYGPQMRDMRKFLKRPVMSGGFKSSYDLNEALKKWREKPKQAPEQLRRQLQNASLDDSFYNTVQQHAALWNAITEQYPMEVIWAIPHIDDFDTMSDLQSNLTAARKYFLGK